MPVRPNPLIHWMYSPTVDEGTKTMALHKLWSRQPRFFFSFEGDPIRWTQVAPGEEMRKVTDQKEIKWLNVQLFRCRQHEN